jgi:hypothetical protein
MSSPLIFQILSTKKIDRSRYFNDFVYFDEFYSDVAYYSLGGQLPPHVITQVTIKNVASTPVYVTTNYFSRKPLSGGATLDLDDVWMDKLIVEGVSDVILLVEGITLEQLGVIV